MTETFADRLKSIRIIRQYTQKQLSEITGISEHTISNYEQGVSIPILDNINLLAESLHVSCDYLCKGGARHRRVWWKCNEGHVWKAMEDFAKCHGCPFCHSKEITVLKKDTNSSGSLHEAKCDE